MNVKEFHNNLSKHESSMATRRSMITRPSALDWRAAESLADWFNRTPCKDPERSRGLVRETIGHLRELNRLYGKNTPTHSDQPESAKSWQALRLILDGLPPVKWSVVPQIIGFQPTGARFRLVLSVEVEKGPGEGFQYLAVVSQAGLLDRVRQCRRCSKWFATRRGDKLFCSQDCQQEFWSECRKTPKGRREQAKRMRLFRAKRKKARRKGSVLQSNGRVKR